MTTPPTKEQVQEAIRTGEKYADDLADAMGDAPAEAKRQEQGTATPPQSSEPTQDDPADMTP